MGVLYLIKRGLQVLHALLAFSFVVLALVEFAEDPPYFDAVAQFNRKHVNATIIPKDTFYVSYITIDPLTITILFRI